MAGTVCTARRAKTFTGVGGRWWCWVRVVTWGVNIVLFSAQFSFFFFLWGVVKEKKQLDSCGILPEFLLLFEL